MDIAPHTLSVPSEAVRPAHTGSVAAPGSVRHQGGRRARGPWMSLSPRIEGSSLGGPRHRHDPRAIRSHSITRSRDFTSCGPYAPAAFRAGGFFVVRATWS